MTRALALFLVLASFATEAISQVPRTLSYQGILTDTLGNPKPDRQYMVRFRLYDAASGDPTTNGRILWTEDQTLQTAKGLFTAILGSVTPIPDSVHFDRPYWLSLALGADPELTPRIPLVAVPYSIHAQVADSARFSTGGGSGSYLPLSGGVMTGPITSTGSPAISMGKGSFGSGNVNEGLQAFAAGGQNRARGAYSVVSGGGGSALGDSNSASGNQSAVGGGHRNYATMGSATVAGGYHNHAFGSASAVGGGSVNEAAGNYAAIPGGANNDASGLNSAVGGGRFNHARGEYAVVSGGGGLTAADSNSALGDRSTVPGGYGNIALGDYSFAAGRNARANHPGTFVWNGGTGTFTSTDTSQFIIYAPGGVGIGTSAPEELLHIRRSSNIGTSARPARMIVEASGLFANDAAIMFTGGTDQGETWSVGVDNSKNAFKITAGTSLRTSFPMLTFDTSGFLRVPVLEITGGSDLAEPFEFSGDEAVDEGSVVSIDPESPGRLRLSDEPYDTKVAGIVSGAGGVRPGLSMNQAEAFPEGKLVALTGRVYCRVDASYGAIRPGDLLTSSPTPGHAMKVTDHEKAHGAILGKAMAGLEHGTGLLLVLVSLQ